MGIGIVPHEIWTMSNSEIIENLQKNILQDIPMGIKSADDLARVEYLLGKLANDYVYLISLLSYSRNYVRQIKRNGPEYKNSYEDMIDKRSTLEDIASAVKLQYTAVSRMLTVRIEMSSEEDMHEFRKEKNI